MAVVAKIYIEAIYTVIRLYLTLTTLISNTLCIYTQRKIPGNLVSFFFLVQIKDDRIYDVDKIVDVRLAAS